MSKDKHLEPEHKYICDELERNKLPVTRENYINFAWGNPKPDPWTAEHEADLPDHLQDWSGILKKKK